ncbi:MAG: amino acid adenylation domain-containing protein, partial [Candidatus Aminicenantes bacterium]
TGLSGNPRFRELLPRVRQVALAAYAHQDLPFEKLVEELQPERSFNRTPLFQVMFILQDAPLAVPGLWNFASGVEEIDTKTSKFDLLLSVMETEGGIMASLQYDTDLFNARTTEQMLQHYRVLLAGITADPDQRISELPLLTELERQRQLEQWNNTRVDYPQDKFIHQLFETRAAQTPGAIAVVLENACLTYRELNHRANQFAWYLRWHGVEPEVVVGICMERCLEMMVGLMGILKAGGAYIPLDPAHPRERLRFILEDARAPVLLTQEHLAKELPGHRAHVVYLDTDWDEIAQQNSENPINSLTPDNLVYIFYTSGSTGAPKGTMILHRGILNYLNWCTKAYGVENGQVIPLHSSIAFDFTITSLFAPLLAGGTVLLLSEAHEMGPAAFQFQGYWDFSLVKISPAHLELFMHQGAKDGILKQTKTLILGGEQLLAKKVASWQQHAPGTVIFNEYGPTETVVGCCVYKVPAGIKSSGVIPIGRPIANTHIYLLNSGLQLVPVGVPGEIYIGGAGLARGYLNNPELTAEKFVLAHSSWLIADRKVMKRAVKFPMSFELSAISYIYKSGDLARYLPDGNIEFLGRADHQIKLRGYRVELGEIESILAGYPAVQEAVVTVQENDAGNQYLAAYVVAQKGKIPTPIRLRNLLQEKLPGYMVPSVFKILDALPLTATGKVDRRALPAPGKDRGLTVEAYVKPRTPVEKILAGMWRDVLGLEQVGVHDNFFRIGGHSLLVTQLLSRIRDTFRVELSLHCFFEKPTVADQAQLIVQQQPEQTNGAGDQADKITQANPEHLITKLDQLSEKEMDSLLSTLLNEKIKEV